jgi:hypothetical protein
MILRWRFMPHEVRAVLRPLLLEYSWLVPGWCRRLSVGWASSEDSAAAAEAFSRPEYLWGEIWIHRGWLEACETERRLAVIHELIHLQLASMQKEHEADINRLFEDGDAPKFKATLHEKRIKAMEQSVQNLAYAIFSLPQEALPRPTELIEEEDEPPLLIARAS